MRIIDFSLQAVDVLCGGSDQASAIHLQAATVSGVQMAAAIASSKPNMGCLVSEPTLAVFPGNQLPQTNGYFSRFQGFASPIWGGNKKPHL